MDYRRTRIFIRSMELVDRVVPLIENMPTGLGFLSEQLRRSVTSVPLTYLEGCGRSGAADRKRFFHYSIGSAEEVAGTLEVMTRFGAVSRAECLEIQRICDHVAHMLAHFR